MASSPLWPFEDDDRPSGSVRPLSQSDLQAILAHLNDDNPDHLLTSTSAGRPVVALRVRVSVGQPGGSAQARWRVLAKLTTVTPVSSATTLGLASMSTTPASRAAVNTKLIRSPGLSRSRSSAIAETTTKIAVAAVSSAASAGSIKRRRRMKIHSHAVNENK